jgi:hypothetical protein
MNIHPKQIARSSSSVLLIRNRNVQPGPCGAPQVPRASVFVIGKMDSGIHDPGGERLVVTEVTIRRCWRGSDLEDDEHHVLG